MTIGDQYAQQRSFDSPRMIDDRAQLTEEINQYIVCTLNSAPVYSLSINLNGLAAAAAAAAFLSA